MLEWLWLLPVDPLSSKPHDEGRGTWILPEIFYWCNSRFSTGHFFSLHAHILQNSYFSSQNVTVSVGICAMCNITHCSQATFFPDWISYPCVPWLHSLSPLKVVSWLQDLQLWPYNSEVCHSKIFASKMSEIKRKYCFIKTGMEGASPFLRISQVLLNICKFNALEQLHNFCRMQHIHYSLLHT